MSGRAVEAAVRRHREGAGGNGEGVCAGGGDREARAVFACAEAVAVAAVFGGGLELEPVYGEGQGRLKLQGCGRAERGDAQASRTGERKAQALGVIARLQRQGERHAAGLATAEGKALDRKSTRLNSSH